MLNASTDAPCSTGEPQPVASDPPPPVLTAAPPSAHPSPPSPAPVRTCGQERTWFLELAYPGHAWLRVAMGARIAGSVLDLETLRDAMARVFARHDVLRCGFGPATETETKAAPAALSVDTLSERRGTAAHEAATARWIADTAGARIDPSRAPLLWARLLRLADDEHLLLLCAHRYVCDEEALGLLMAEIAGQLDGHLTVGPDTASFADFVAWQRHQPPALLAYWLERLAGAAPIFELPVDRARPASRRYAGASLPLTLPIDLVARLRRLAAKRGHDLQSVLLAALASLLQRHSGQSDLVVGLHSSYRCEAPFSRLVGPLDNTLALRLDLSGDVDSDALLDLTKTALEEAAAHAALPFERLIEALAAGHGTGYAPICQVLFDYRNTPELPTLRAGPSTLRPFAVDLGTSTHDLCLRVDDCNDGLGARLIYDPALFDEATIRRMADHYLSLLGDLAADSRKPAATLRLLTAAEWQRTVHEWNATEGEYPADSSLSLLFEQQADRSPDAPAVLGPGGGLSYRELDEQANRLAHHLVKLGVGHETMVGVAMERSPELFVAVLAILKAGACYVPLDPTYPTQRLSAMLADSAVGQLLTKACWLDRLPAHDARTLCLDRDWPAIAAEPVTRPASPAGASSLAYVVFTSGSTGRPKGVLIEQRQLLNRLAWMWREYPFAAGDVSACKTALNFVDSLWELLGPLLRGVPSVVVPQATLLDPHVLVALLAEYRASRMMLVPSLLRMLLDAHDMHAADNRHNDLAAQLPLLREWCIGGEPLTVELARRFAHAMPGRLLLNLYGLSEAFDACFFDAGRLTETDTLVPIGRPLANVQAYVLDGHRQPVPVGVVGELYIGGAGLARGYLGRPELSAEKFIANPFVDRPGARIYRTGDLARYRANGLIDYLGRADQQVKIRGFRVEPDEVGTVLRSHPDIAAAVVVARPAASGESGELTLAAYVVPRQIPPPTTVALQSWLKERLPDYMVPASCTVLGALPMTPSGKVDRLSLPAPAAGRAALETPYIAPTDDTEQAIAAIWQTVLQLPRVGKNDNFFDLGGTSLRLVEVNRRLCEHLQRAIPILQMYQHPTVSSLARSLALAGGESSAAAAAAAASVPSAPSSAQAGRERAAQRQAMRVRRQPGGTNSSP